MASSADVEALRAQFAAASTLATSDVRGFFGSLNLNRPEATRNALLEFVPAVAAQYGDATALVAADFYDEQRDLAGVRGSYRASMAETVPAEFVQESVRFHASHLFTDTPAAMLAPLLLVTDRNVKQPGRDTIQIASIEDPQATGWHRQPRPTESYANGCGFCRMLAGRGGVYRKQTAHFGAHGDCNCVALPSWDANATEVPAEVYRASERTSAMTDAQRERHRANIREWIAAH